MADRQQQQIPKRLLLIHLSFIFLVIQDFFGVCTLLQSTVNVCPELPEELFDMEADKLEDESQTERYENNHMILKLVNPYGDSRRNDDDSFREDCSKA